MDRVGRGIAVLAIAVMALAGVGVSQASASTSATPAVGGPCTVYTPTALTISVPQANPGQTVTITGKGVATSTVSISISGTSYPSQTLGSVVVGPTGSFAKAVTLPSNLTPGTFTITVSNPSCPAPGTITIVIIPNTTVSCSSNPTVIQRNQVVTWKLFTVFSTAQPTSLYLVPQFFLYPTTQVYYGTFPASGQVTFTVPGSAPDGSYYVTQTGILWNGSLSSQACAVKVSGTAAAKAAATTTTVKPATTTTVAPATVLGQSLSTPAAQLASYSGSGGSNGSGSSTDGRLALIAALAVAASAGLLMLQKRHRHHH